MSMASTRDLGTEELEVLVHWFTYRLSMEHRGRLMAELPVLYVKLFGTGCREAVAEHVERALRPCAVCGKLQDTMVHKHMPGGTQWVLRDGHQFVSDAEARLAEVVHQLPGCDPGP